MKWFVSLLAVFAVTSLVAACPIGSGYSFAPVSYPTGPSACAAPPQPMVGLPLTQPYPADPGPFLAPSPAPCPGPVAAPFPSAGGCNHSYSAGGNGFPRVFAPYGGYRTFTQFRTFAPQHHFAGTRFYGPPVFRGPVFHGGFRGGFSGGFPRGGIAFGPAARIAARAAFGGPRGGPAGGVRVRLFR